MIAMSVIISVPTTTVGIENCPRRGNQPPANSCDGSIFERNVRASNTRESTIVALIKIDSAAAPNRIARMTPSFRRLTAVPCRRLPDGGTLITLISRPSRSVAIGPGLLGGREGVGGEVHVWNRFEDLRDRPVGEVEVDVSRYRGVCRGLGLVDIDVQAPRQRICAVRDRRVRRLDAVAVGGL